MTRVEYFIVGVVLLLIVFLLWCLFAGAATH